MQVKPSALLPGAHIEHLTLTTAKMEIIIMVVIIIKSQKSKCSHRKELAGMESHEQIIEGLKFFLGKPCLSLLSHTRDPAMTFIILHTTSYYGDGTQSSWLTLV